MRQRHFITASTQLPATNLHLQIKKINKITKPTPLVSQTAV